MIDLYMLTSICLPILLDLSLTLCYSKDSPLLGLSFFLFPMTTEFLPPLGPSYCENPKFQVLRLLIECEYIDPLIEALKYEFDIDERFMGQTILHVAAKEKNPQLSKIVIEGGADVNAKSYMTGNTPLHIASAHANTELVQILLDAGAERDIKNRQGLTAIEKVPNIHSNRSRIIELLKDGATKKGNNAEIKKRLTQCISDLALFRENIYNAAEYAKMHKNSPREFVSLYVGLYDRIDKIDKVIKFLEEFDAYYS